MFKKILIANRGEIACRIIKTARNMGIRTVAVYSETDRDALHVDSADEAVFIGSSPSRESYLVADKIIAASRHTGAQAIHPGYGFLSENELFAKRLEAEGIVFIGPKHQAIAAMGDKIASKKLALAAGVNTIPGHNDAIDTADSALEIANRIGYPVMLKASAGGGGKGLRIAWNDSDCKEAYTSCRNEALNAFGDDRIFIEKFIEHPRHIEIQVLGDAHGNMVYLWERECSIQRRHQKVIEEAPSLFLDNVTRQAMGEQAVALAKAVHYQSAGTVEFVVGPDKQFYFLEMNTRLQVEHPVTEMITDIDLVEHMIRIAAGEKLAFRQDDIPCNGWALECRINAEDPFRDFLPSSGRLVRYIAPEASNHVRVDSGVYEGGEIPVHYDAMIAKLITHGQTRDDAIAHMRDALNSFVIRGVSSNTAFQAALIQHPRFVSGQLHTGFIAEEFPEGFHPTNAVHEDPVLLAAVGAFIRCRYVDRAVKIDNQLPGHHRRVSNDWVAVMNDEHYALSLDAIEDGYTVRHHNTTHELKSHWRFGEILFRGTWNGKLICLQIERQGLKYRLTHFGTQTDVMVMTERTAHLLSLMPVKPQAQRAPFLLSPMPGLLTGIAVSVGQAVKRGERLAVIEAMKMENILKAEADCTVLEILVTAGDSLSVDQPIMRFG